MNRLGLSGEEGHFLALEFSFVYSFFFSFSFESVHLLRNGVFVAVEAYSIIP